MARKMKDSGIEWIGEIPEDWEIVRIAGLYKLRNTKVSDEDYEPLSVTKKGIVSQLDNAAKTNDHANRKLVKKHDFVINSRSDRKGSCGIAPKNGSVSLINTVLKPLEIMNSKYYNYTFKTPSFAEEFYRWGNGIVDDLWTTNWNKMKDINVPNPSLKEQKEIANFIDNKINIINDLISTVTQQIQTLENYKKSVITEAVTKGLDKNAEMKDSGIEWIGEIPKHWKVDRIKNITSKSERGTSPSYTDDKTMNKVVNQATFSQGFFDKLNIRYSDIPLNQSKGKLETNDVLIASTGGGVLGKVHYFEELEVYVADGHITILRTNHTIQNSKYLYYIFSTLYDLINGVLAKGSTNQIELQVYWLNNFKVPCPDIQEQQLIVSYLDEKTKTINDTIAAKEKQLEVLEDYKKSLIYEYVTGKKEV